MSHQDLLDTDILTYLKRHENKDLLRFVAVGSVDDGKSTLIGRLLHDARAVMDDQLLDARSPSGDGTVDLARLTDGLRAEREQGITIDVAYRYFTTARRKFIIADTPGHVQYTRNMATGASTADVAITLIDARYGVLQQSRRHACIASLLGIRRLVVAINKMDLVAWDAERYHAICEDFRRFAHDLHFEEVRFFPISALLGDNVVDPSAHTPWYQDGTLLHYLEEVPIEQNHDALPLRFPVQTVIRPNLNYRGFAGQVASGVVRPGDAIRVLPSGRTSRVRAIDTWDGALDEAFPPLGVVLRLEDEIDITRGDLIVHDDFDLQPLTDRNIDAMVVWLSEQPLDPNRSYLIKHCSRYVRTDVRRVEYRLDLETMQQAPASRLDLNDIGHVRFTTHRPLHFDPYRRDRTTGAFILIDTLTNNTVGAGMILDPADLARTGIDEHLLVSTVTHAERAQRAGHPPRTLWIHGTGAETLAAVAYQVERALFDRGVLPAVLEARDTEGTRPDTLPLPALIETAARLNDAGVTVLAAVAEATRADREDARLRVTNSRWLEVLLPEHAEIDEATALVLEQWERR
jgi:bifunctional enzyme CysN/CysC